MRGLRSLWQVEIDEVFGVSTWTGRATEGARGTPSGPSGEVPMEVSTLEVIW